MWNFPALFPRDRTRPHALLFLPQPPVPRPWKWLRSPLAAPPRSRHCNQHQVPTALTPLLFLEQNTHTRTNLSPDRFHGVENSNRASQTDSGAAAAPGSHGFYRSGLSHENASRPWLPASQQPQQPGLLTTDSTGQRGSAIQQSTANVSLEFTNHVTLGCQILQGHSAGAGEPPTTSG